MHLKPVLDLILGEFHGQDAVSEPGQRLDQDLTNGFLKEMRVDRFEDRTLVTLSDGLLGYVVTIAFPDLVAIGMLMTLVGVGGGERLAIDPVDESLQRI